MSGYRFFDTQTVAIFRAVAGTVVPSEPESPGGDAEPCIVVADEALGARAPADQKLVKTFLKVIDILPLLRFGRRFTKLDLARRERVLRFLERNRVPKLRAGFFGVKTFALMGYYGSTEAFEELGYPGPRMDAPYYEARGEAP